MFPTKITENKPKSTFCMAKRDSSHFCFCRVQTDLKIMGINQSRP